MNHILIHSVLEKKTNEKETTFLDININEDTKNVICGWYRKQIDAGTILNFSSCSSFHYKKNIIEGAVHRIFGNTSMWSKFGGAMKVNRKQWVDNQYQELLSDKIVLRTLHRLIKGTAKKSLSKGLHQGSFDNTGTPSMMVVQYRGLESLILANEVRNIIKAPIFFQHQKFGNLPTILKEFFFA